MILKWKASWNLAMAFNFVISAENYQTNEVQIGFLLHWFTWNCCTSWAASRVQFSLYNMLRSSVIDHKRSTVLKTIIKDRIKFIKQVNIIFIYCCSFLLHQHEYVTLTFPLNLDSMKYWCCELISQNVSSLYLNIRHIRQINEIFPKSYKN